MTLELKGITKRVEGHVHIKETSLRLEPGHFNVLLGETGAGKTSLIKLMAGLDRCASGSIEMDGVDVTRQSTSSAISRWCISSSSIIRICRSSTISPRR